MKWTYEDLKSFAAARCIDLFKAVKPQDVAALPEAAQALWKIGWEMSAQYVTSNSATCAKRDAGKGREGGGMNKQNEKVEFQEGSTSE